MSNMFVVWQVRGLEAAGGALLIIWRILLGSVATCCPTPNLFAEKYSKQTNTVCFIKDDIKVRKVLPKEAWAHPSHWYLRQTVLHLRL